MEITADLGFRTVLEEVAFDKNLVGQEGFGLMFGRRSIVGG